MINPPVIVDGQQYSLNDYPQAQLDFFDYIGMDDPVEQAAYLEAEEYCPDGALNIAVREFDNAILLENRILLCRVIGAAEEVMFANNSEQHRSAPYLRSYGSDANFDIRFTWLHEKCRGQFTVSWRRNDTGDGILLDEYVFSVAFHDPADDAAFLAAFPGAAA